MLITDSAWYAAQSHIVGWLSSVEHWLKAIDGIPKAVAIIAAPTVPDKTVSNPTFEPLLMPDSTRSGNLSAIRCFIANNEQSAGVP